MTAQERGFIDLHRHLDGNIKAETILALAIKNKLPIVSHDIDILQKHVYIDDKTSDLLAFLQSLDLGVSMLASLDDCYRVAYENVQYAVEEGLQYIELRFSPYYMANTHKLNVEGVVEAVADGLKAANKDFGYHANLIGILSRSYGADICQLELNALLKYSSNLVAIDLAGNEKDFPASMFVEHFKLVRDSGLGVTIHAGEADGPKSIWDAITLLGATRIGHGVSAHQDIKLMEYMSSKKIGIESCLLSNYQTGAWTNIATHPIKTFLEFDIPVCLNTDDPGVSNNTLANEYMLAKNIVKLSEQEIERCRQNAIDMSFIDKLSKKS